MMPRVWTLFRTDYKKTLDPTKSAICLRFEEEDVTVRHWLVCPASMRIREDVFGKANYNLEVLSQKPLHALLTLMSMN